VAVQTILTSIFIFVISLHAEAFTIDDLSRVVREQKITSVEQLLPTLPQPLLRNYTLVYDSLSLQAASSENPRAILFDSTGRLILSFNGHESQKGFREIEAISFDPETSRINLHRVEFGPGQAPRITNNPRECVACHGSPARYIWPTYNRWTNTFGSQGDLLDAIELPAFANFRAQAEGHPRYKHLLTPAGEKYWPYFARKEQREIFRMPNFRLAVLMAFNQAAAEFTRAHDNPQFQSVKHQLIRDILCSGGRTDSKAALMSLVPGLARNLELQWDENSPAWRSGAGDLAEMFAFKALMALDLDPRLLQQLAMIRFPKTVEAFVPGPYPLDIELLVPKFAAYTMLRTSDSENSAKAKVCAQIRKRAAAEEQSLISLRAASELNSKLNSASPKQLVLQKGCVHCHDSGFHDLAPRIPFSQPDDLRAYLLDLKSNGIDPIEHVRYRIGGGKEYPTRREVMPRSGGALTPHERETLIRYLSGLLN
jgi:hypothetical protein